MSSGERKRKRLNRLYVKLSGVVQAVLWDVVVLVLPDWGWHVRGVSGRLLERVAVVGESPVRENMHRCLDGIPE